MFNIFNKRFGGETYSEPTNVNRLKMVVSGLAIFSLIVCTALVYFLISPVLNSTNQDSALASSMTAASQIEILVAKQRIEEGTVLRDDLFETLPTRLGLVRAGTIFANEKLSVIGNYAKYVINAGTPINQDDITDVRPNTPFRIPPGHRAVTITVDARSGVEGFAKPNSRVDVIWCFTESDGGKQVRTIVPFAKVLSVGGATQTEEAPAVQGNSTTATLLVKNREAKVIELARNMGTLSLTLVGNEETAISETDTETISLKDVLGVKRDDLKNKTPSLDGEFWTLDPQTGRKEKFVLKNNKWERELRND